MRSTLCSREWHSFQWPNTQLLDVSANVFWLVLLVQFLGFITIRFLLTFPHMFFHYAGEFAMSHSRPDHLTCYAVRWTRSTRLLQDFPKQSETTQQSAVSKHANIIPQGIPAWFVSSCHTGLQAPKPQSRSQKWESSLEKVFITYWIDMADIHSCNPWGYFQRGNNTTFSTYLQLILLHYPFRCRLELPLVRAVLREGSQEDRLSCLPQRRPWHYPPNGPHVALYITSSSPRSLGCQTSYIWHWAQRYEMEYSDSSTVNS